MKRVTAATLLFVLGASGCATTPPSVYVLNKANLESRPIESQARSPVIQLAPVLIPDYLDTADIQWRLGEHELHSSSTGHWSERLSAGIAEALRSDLAGRLPMDDITLRRSGKSTESILLVTIDTFDCSSDGHCVLSANWTVVPPGHGVAAGTPVEHAVLSTPAGAASLARDPAIVAGMSQSIDELAGRIATTLDGLR
jgi:uncharacterized lipoprotein YmbA